MGILNRFKGKARLRELQEHRLAVFNAAYDDYCKGLCPASYLTHRARLMLEAGLPENIKRGRKQ